MDWAQILVIILATLFAIFLIVAIVLGFLIVKVTRQIKTAASSAERTVAAVESAMLNMNKAALPLTILRMVMKQVTKPKSSKKERRQ